MSAHTKGRLRVGMERNVSALILDRNPGYIAICGACPPFVLGEVVAIAGSKANAARLVACWNECEQHGMPSHLIEAHEEETNAYENAAREANAQRDELLAALQSFTTFDTAALAKIGGAIVEIQRLARTVVDRIAKAGAA